jgi:hypothetical protein
VAGCIDLLQPVLPFAVLVAAKVAMSFLESLMLLLCAFILPFRVRRSSWAAKRRFIQAFRSKKHSPHSPNSPDDAFYNRLLHSIAFAFLCFHFGSLRMCVFTPPPPPPLTSLLTLSSSLLFPSSVTSFSSGSGPIASCHLWRFLL